MQHQYGRTFGENERDGLSPLQGTREQVEEAEPIRATRIAEARALVARRIREYAEAGTQQDSRAANRIQERGKVLLDVLEWQVVALWWIRRKDRGARALLRELHRKTGIG